MTDTFLSPAFIPFSIALGLLFGLMVLELLSLMLGGSLLGMQAEADTDFEFDLDGAEGLEGIDADLDMIDADAAIEAQPVAGPDWLGIKQVPILIWFAAFLLGFSLSGMILQTLLLGTLGFALPVMVASLIAALSALGFSRSFAKGFARLLPKNETQALSENHLGRRHGVVSQGTAKRGKPAEVRVIDHYGNAHYLRAEPLRDEDEIPQGTQVLVMRKSRDEGYRMVALSM